MEQLTIPVRELVPPRQTTRTLWPGEFLGPPPSTGLWMLEFGAGRWPVEVFIANGFDLSAAHRKLNVTASRVRKRCRPWCACDEIVEPVEFEILGKDPICPIPLQRFQVCGHHVLSHQRVKHAAARVLYDMNNGAGSYERAVEDGWF